MTLKDIFSDVSKRHSPDETARVFIAGTSLTTPEESEMLAGWQKPFLFARFFLITALTLAVAMVLPMLNCYRGYDVILVGLPVLVPFTVLLLTWEMNIPRSISLAQVLGIVALGGVLSIVFTMIFEQVNPFQGAQWAPVTEEPAKLAIILLLLRKKNYKYITEGVLLGMAVGTGFAVMETMSYVLDSLRESMVVLSVNNRDWIMELYNQGYSVDAITIYLFEEAGVQGSLTTAILRAVNAVAGHGMLAAFYGGGIMIAKQREPFRMEHLLNIHFLKYFAISFLLHYLNNSQITHEIFPYVGPIWTYSFVQTAVAVILFLPLLRQGVNQVVDITLQHNQGRLTFAIERGENNGPQKQPQQQQYQQPQQAAPAGKAIVQFLTGPNAGRSYTVGAGYPITIGRAAGQCELAMPACGKVSSRHLALEVRGGEIFVTDLNSTNGTYVGSRRLSPNVPTAVDNGSVVYLGTQDCSFRVYIQ